MALLSKRELDGVIKTVLGAAMAPDVLVSVRQRQVGNLRFARNQATTEGDVETIEVSVTASIQGRTATAVGNQTSKAALEALIAEAEELAALSPIDPEHMPAVDSSLFLQVAGPDKATAKLDARQRVDRVAQAIAAADAADVELSGYLEHYEQVVAMGTSAGASAYWPSTSASLTTTCRSRDKTGSGWAGGESHRIQDLDSAGLTQLAAEKAEMSRTPKTLEPGKQLVLLEAQAVADLLEFLLGALDARAADEGRSWFSHPDGGARIGEELFHPSIHLHSNPADKQHPAAPFTDAGEPHKVVDWIRDGVLTSLTNSRYWAQKSGGIAIPAPSSVILDGDDVELLDLVRAVDRGVLVTRFWYNRTLDPRTILATGLTRDGTFLVEQGKITSAVKNFRYNDSPITMLQNVLALGRPQRVVTRGGRVVVVPPMVVKDFNFASLSDAV